MEQEILSMKGITKVYPNGIVANKDVDFSVRKGEIHALMGENGAGKSTLMNILFGAQTPEKGEIILNGEKININNPTEAIKYGIGMVHQHFMLVPSLTVAENIFLGMETTKKGVLDMKNAETQTQELAKIYNFDIDASARVADVSVGTKQKIEILKALARGAKILILDEPTAVLTPQETDELFKELILFKEKGHTIIFISHKLKEIKQICDRITIMKDGRSVGVYDVTKMEEKDISRLMVGRDVVTKIPKKPMQALENILEVRNVSCTNSENKVILNNINLRIRKGEILGIAGVEGNGQLELVETIAGMRKIETGEIFVDGECINGKSVKQIRKKGVSHIPEDRMSVGIAGEASILDNLISDKIDEKEFKTGLVFNSKKIKEYSNKMVKDFLVKCDSYSQQVSMLSGGNMQKVVVAREFSSNPKIMIADQPSRGVDVGAIEFIHKKIIDFRDAGSGVLLVSADLNEVIELSDTLIILYNGEICAYIEDTNELTEEDLGYYMLGLKKQSQEDIKERMLHDK